MITSILAFVLAFGVLVIVHEFGHFWVARRVGITVEIFSIGFGPKIFSRKLGETDFCVSLIPLGGYVKMRGQGDEVEEEEDPNDPGSFANKSVLQRTCVVLAGPVMNLILSFALIPFVFWIGKPEPIYIQQPPVVERILSPSPAEKAGFEIGDRIIRLNGKITPTWEVLLESLSMMGAGKELAVEVERNGSSKTLSVTTENLPQDVGSFIGIEKFFGDAPKPLVQAVLPDSPAAKGGLQAGDLILSIQNNPVKDWDSLIRQVNQMKGEPLQMAIKRGEATLNFAVQPKWSDESKRWLLGIQSPQSQEIKAWAVRKYNFLQAIRVGFHTNVDRIKKTFRIVKQLVTNEVSYKSLGGPVAIASSLAKASASGLADFIDFTTFLSIQLGILNLLPIPVLDGGHLLFFLFEGIRSKPLAIKTRMIATQVGMVLLFTLIIFVTWNDLKKLLF